jgi:hypothetical protein
VIDQRTKYICDIAVFILFISAGAFRLKIRFGCEVNYSSGNLNSIKRGILYWFVINVFQVCTTLSYLEQAISSKVT